MNLGKDTDSITADSVIKDCNTSLLLHSTEEEILSAHSPVISINMPIAKVNKREEDYSCSNSHYEKCSKLGRIHDLCCGKNEKPQVRIRDPSNIKHLDSKYQKSLKRMSPKHDRKLPDKIKKEKHVMRTRKTSRIPLNNEENQTDNQMVENEQDSNNNTQTEETHQNIMLDPNAEIVIDSTTNVDVFMIMFLVGLYASRQYGHRNQTNSDLDEPMEVEKRNKTP